jgi:charged multivesicular body protein 6
MHLVGNNHSLLNQCLCSAPGLFYVTMGNTSSRVTAQDKAILDLKNQRDKLHQYQKRITVLTDREMQIAKQMLALGDKKRALLALRRKKYQESLLSKTDGQLEQLEKLTSSVEFALIQKDVLYGLQQGTKVLKEIHAEMGGIDHVEKLMGETADAIAYQQVCLVPTSGFVLDVMLIVAVVQEVSEMLGGKISNQDEDEVEDELAALEAEVRGTNRIPEIPLPTVPDTELEGQTPETEPRPARRQQEERQAMLA